MKRYDACFTIGFSIFMLATNRVQAQVIKSEDKFIGNYKANNINSDLNRIDLQNNSDSYLGQVTNVESLRDVAPTDWAYEALSNLVNRYSCITGFPDRTFRGSQPFNYGFTSL